MGGGCAGPAKGVDGHAERLRPGTVQVGLAGRTDEGALRTEDPVEHLPADRRTHLARVVQLDDPPARFLSVSVTKTAPPDVPDQGFRSPVEGFFMGMGSLTFWSIEFLLTVQVLD